MWLKSVQNDCLYEYDIRLLSSVCPEALNRFTIQMYQYGYESYNPEEAADILARREAEEKAAAKRIEQIRNRERKSKSLDMLLSLMESILKKVIFRILFFKSLNIFLEQIVQIEVLSL